MPKCRLGHVKLIIWFSDTDFLKNDEGGRVFNFCIYMHIGPIFRFHFIDCYHSELPKVTTSTIRGKHKSVPNSFNVKLELSLFDQFKLKGAKI